MPIRFKEGFDTGPYIREAARRRAEDEPHRKFTAAELEQRTSSVLQTSFLQLRPAILAGGLLSSADQTKFLKDTRMAVNILASEGKGLEQEIRQGGKRNFAVLDDIQREALALDAAVTEDEIQINERYTAVHYNTFVRPEDMPLAWDNPNWLVDPKTSLSFTADNMLDLIPNTGLTLPLKERVNIPILKIVLAGEDTDVGDTEKPIVSTNPMDLLRKDRVFRHVIIRREHDETGRKYNHTPSFCTLLLTFASIQLVNSLDLRPLGQSTVYIEELSYINEVGEEIQLTELELSSETMTTVLFEPIRARYLKVKLRQYAPVTKSNWEGGDLRIRELNKLLRGAGFSQLLTENNDPIQGRVFDFSLETISASLRIYESTGVFRSQPIKVNKPIGVRVSDIVESIQISNDNRTYGVQPFLEEGEVLNEYYLGVELNDPGKHRAFRELVPIPDSYPVQKEFLPVFSSEAKVKLFPDMVWNLDKKTASSAAYLVGILAVITEEPHGLDFPVGEIQTAEIQFVAGPGEPDYNVTSVSWFVVDDNQVWLQPNDGGLLSDQLDIKHFRPYLYLTADIDEPISVFKENEQLFIGTDYEISFDSGATYKGTFPQDERWLALKSKARAGSFRIKFTNPDHNKLYLIDYRPLKNQKLSQRRGVELKNGRVVFTRRLAETSGAINTVVISRADSTNPYLTPVTLSYFLKVRENVN